MAVTKNCVSQQLSLLEGLLVTYLIAIIDLHLYFTEETKLLEKFHPTTHP